MSNSPNWKALGNEARAAAETKAADLQDAKQAQAAFFAESYPEVIDGFKRAQKALLEVMSECNRIAQQFNAGAGLPELELKVNSSLWSEPSQMLSFELSKGKGIQLSSFTIHNPGEIAVKTYSKNRPFAGHNEIYIVEENWRIFLKDNDMPFTASEMAAITCERLIELQDV